MLKNTLAIVSLAALLNIGSAFAEDKAAIAPGKGAGPTDAMTEQTPTMKPEVPQPSTTYAAGEAAPANAAPAAPCTQEALTAMITKAGALTDKDKKMMTMGHLDLAQKSLNQKDLTACAMHVKEAQVNLGTVTK